FCQVYSEESRIPHGKIPPIHLTFLPHPVAILASSDHLVLAASLEFEHIIQDARFVGPTKNYICNPLNKEWVELPMVIPPEYIAGYGFVCEPTSCKKQLGCTTNSRYRVVMIGLAHSDSNVHLGRRGLCMDNEFVTKVFCSEIGQWNEFVITYPQHKTVISKPRGWGPSRNRDLVVVASNGVLYWLEGLPFKGIVAFDPFNDIHTEQCRLIHLPTMCFKSTFYSTDTKLRLGVVNGQLRLSQLYKAETYFVFRVWELKNHHSESPSWVLVYNLKLRSSENELFVLSFHPNNTNVVFLLCGNNVCQYDISEKKYEKVGEHPGDYMDDPSVDIATFTLPHPSCPTMLPLSSN
ncbi:F-box family protein, partial [Trema orientale]